MCTAPSAPASRSETKSGGQNQLTAGVQALLAGHPNRHAKPVQLLRIAAHKVLTWRLDKGMHGNQLLHSMRTRTTLESGQGAQPT